MASHVQKVSMALKEAIEKENEKAATACAIDLLAVGVEAFDAIGEALLRMARVQEHNAGLTVNRVDKDA